MLIQRRGQGLQLHRATASCLKRVPGQGQPGVTSKQLHAVARHLWPENVGKSCSTYYHKPVIGYRWIMRQKVVPFLVTGTYTSRFFQIAVIKNLPSQVYSLSNNKYNEVQSVIFRYFLYFQILPY